MSAADHVRAGSDAGLTNRISGTLAEHLYLGRSIQYQVVTPLGAVDAVETNAAVPRAADGGTLELRVSAQETVVLPAD